MPKASLTRWTSLLNALCLKFIDNHKEFLSYLKYQALINNEPQTHLAVYSDRIPCILDFARSPEAASILSGRWRRPQCRLDVVMPQCEQRWLCQKVNNACHATICTMCIMPKSEQRFNVLILAYMAAKLSLIAG